MPHCAHSLMGSTLQLKIILFFNDQRYMQHLLRVLRFLRTYLFLYQKHVSMPLRAAVNTKVKDYNTSYLHLYYS